MGIAQHANTTFWYTDDWMFGWIVSVGDSDYPSDVYSISYGGQETGLESSYTSSFNNEAIKLGTMGVTLLVASGDTGAPGSYGNQGTKYCGYNPQFPASSPYVTTVGATMYIDYIKIPTYFNASGRGYPDVALLGHSYMVVIGESIQVEDGTSASTPVMAAFVTLANQQRVTAGTAKMGFLNPFLYENSAKFVHDVTSGNNKSASVETNGGSSGGNPSTVSAGGIAGIVVAVVVFFGALAAFAGYYFYYGAGRHSGENVVKANTSAFNFDTETGGTGASELTAVGGSKGIDQTDNPILEAQQVKTLPSAPPTV
eukprot:gene14930-10678_t